MTKPRIVIAGAGAAGFFAAIACAETNPSAEVTLLEATAHPLAKVRISGGGRCNVTHACFEPKELVTRYPRGGRELLGAFHRWQARDTVNWFESRGVPLKTEPDGRMFPVSDQSASIIDCLERNAARLGVRVRTRCGLTSVKRTDASKSEFILGLTSGETVSADRLLLSTGGTRGSAGFTFAQQFGHVIEPLAPSLFTFNIKDTRLADLAGIAVATTTASVRELKLAEAGPTLITHWGVSGPAILRLSAWGARELQACEYRFTVRINWAGGLPLEKIRAELATLRTVHPRRQISTHSHFAIPQRLWERLIAATDISPTAVWAGVSKASLAALAEQLGAGDFLVAGKSTNKEEFVTCGGVRLSEVDFRTMESRLCPGLHFAGEILDIDGITGGFNFQSAWTTGMLAGRALARATKAES